MHINLKTFKSNQKMLLINQNFLILQINISQEEYAFKYKLYLEKVRHRQMYESNNDVEDFFTQRQLFSFKHLCM